MALDQQIKTSDKIRDLVGSFETAGICFDGRSEKIIETYSGLQSSPMQRYRCLVELCKDRFGVKNPNVAGYLRRTDFRVSTKNTFGQVALKSHSGFRTVVAMLSCNGGC